MPISWRWRGQQEQRVIGLNRYSTINTLVGRCSTSWPAPLGPISPTSSPSQAVGPAGRQLDKLVGPLAKLSDSADGSTLIADTDWRSLLGTADCLWNYENLITVMVTHTSTIGDLSKQGLYSKKNHLFWRLQIGSVNSGLHRCDKVTSSAAVKRDHAIANNRRRTSFPSGCSILFHNN